VLATGKRFSQLFRWLPLFRPHHHCIDFLFIPHRAAVEALQSNMFYLAATSQRLNRALSGRQINAIPLHHTHYDHLLRAYF